MSKTKSKKTKKKAASKASYKPLPSKLKVIGLAICLASCFILYFQSLSFGYVLDDTIVFTENNYVKRGLAGYGDILSHDSFSGYFGEQKNLVQGARYRPLSLLTFATEYALFGANSSVSHLLNILLYGLCCFVGFITLRRLFREKSSGYKILYGTAAISIMLYLFHPIHVEAIANVKGRDEILSLLFSLLTLQVSLKYVDQKKIVYLILIPLLYFTGLLAKENTITFMAIIPAAILLFRPKQKKAMFLVLGLLFIMSLCYLGLRYSIIGYLLGDEPSTDLMNNSFVGMNTMQRYATIFYTLLIYLKLHIFPHPLTHDYYPYHIPIMDFSNWQVWLSIGIHVLLIVIGFLWMKKRKKVAFGLFLYFAAMSIVSNLVVSIGTFMNERFAFAASLGMCIIFGYILTTIAKKSGENKQLLLNVLVGTILLL